MESITEECFLCTRNYNCVPVDQKIIAQVEYLLPEITIIKLGVPLRICSVCDGSLYNFNNFKQFSLETSRILEERIKKATPSLQTNNSKYVTDSEMSDIEDIEEPNLPIENLEYIPLDFDNLETEFSKKQSTKNDEDIETDASEQENETINTCEVCDRSFKTKYSLKRHMKVHPTLFPCKDCWLVFENESELKTHQENSHPDTLPKNIQQNTDKNTNSGNKNEDEIKIKKENSHPNKMSPKNIQQNTDNSNKKDEIKFENLIKEKDQGTYECPICKKIFPRKDNLQKHMKIHSENRFQCYICKKVFRHKDLLIFHTKRAHTDFKKYPCSQCDRSFTNPTELYNHLKRHGVLPEFPCHLCDKKFTYFSDLKLHTKTHIKVTGYSCDICNKVFKQKWNRDKHYKIHYRDNEYKCEICHKKFLRINLLFNHLKLHENN